MVEGYPTLAAIPVPKPVPKPRRLMVLCLVYLHPENPTPGNEAGQVLLVRKREPKWQVGKWNGPGGVVEPGELVYVAASRELLEEAGVSVKPSQWFPVASLEGEGFRVEVVNYHFPKGSLPALLAMSPEEAYTAGREWAQWFPVDHLPKVGNEYGEQRHPDRRGGVVYDLNWLIPFSLDGRFNVTTFDLRTDLEAALKAGALPPMVGGRETDEPGTVVATEPPTDETEAAKFPAATGRQPFMSKALREKLYAADAEIARKEAERLGNPPK
jgi:8-oxo-dGTP diphosphatase